MLRDHKSGAQRVARKVTGEAKFAASRLLATVGRPMASLVGIAGAAALLKLEGLLDVASPDLAPS